MATCPDVVKRLIERFDQQADQVRSPDYNETQLRIDFVNPMFAQLGWDMDNAQGFAEQLQRQIDATDRRIDQFVYGLYGRTETEKQLVEDSKREEPGQ
jgi:hypothetical protein